MYSFCCLFFPSSVFEFAVMQGSITVTPFPGSGFLEAGSAPFAGFPPFAGFLPFTPSAFLPFAVPGAGAGLGWAGAGLPGLGPSRASRAPCPWRTSCPSRAPCTSRVLGPSQDHCPSRRPALVSFERFAPCSQTLYTFVFERFVPCSQTP